MRVRKTQGSGLIAGVFVALALAVGLTAAPPAQAQDACADESLPWSSGELERLRAAVLCLVNHERVARGIRPMKLDDRLNLAAQRHSEDMDRRGYFDHRTMGGEDSPFPHGGTLCDRVEAAGYPSCDGVAENLGVTETPLSEVRGNIEDTTHCSPMLQGSRDDIGVGVAGGKWTIDVGREQYPYTGANCPSKLMRDGPDLRVPSLEPHRPIVGRTAVTLPVTCHVGAGPCVLTWQVRRGKRVDRRGARSLEPGQKARIVIRPSKRSLRILRRAGRLKINFRMQAKYIDEDIQYRDFVLRG